MGTQGHWSWPKLEEGGKQMQDTFQEAELKEFGDSLDGVHALAQVTDLKQLVELKWEERNNK